MSRNGTKIIIVEDNVQFRANLKNYLESELGCYVIGEASDGIEYLSLPNKLSVDIILIDIVMDNMDGITNTKNILSRHSRLNIIAMIEHIDKVSLTQLVESGFKGCVFKFDLFNQLPDAFLAVLKGSFYFPEDISI